MLKDDNIECIDSESVEGEMLEAAIINEKKDEDEEDQEVQEDEATLEDIELNAQALEALLFANGEELPLSRIKDVLQVSEEQILYWVEELKKKYNSDDSSFELIDLNHQYQLRTKDIYSGIIRKLKNFRKSVCPCLRKKINEIFLNYRI